MGLHITFISLPVPAKEFGAGAGCVNRSRCISRLHGNRQ